MGLLRSLTMLLVPIWWFCSVVVSLELSAESLSNARELDVLLQDYAYRAFVRPRTGVVYDGMVPANLSGIQVSALRLRSGSLRKKGYSMYKEFEIPVGVQERPYVERLVLVYENLGNRSMTYYPLQGYMYLAPVLGFLAYDASNLMAKNLPVLDIRATDEPISIRFSEMRTAPTGVVPKCVFFDLNGTVNFSNVLPNNVCMTFQQGHFSIVVESIAPSPSPLSPVPTTPPQPGGRPPPPGGQGGKSNTKRVWKIVGFTVGGFALLAMLGLLVVCLLKYRRKKKMHRMEKAAEVGESLHMTTVGSTKAPAATGTRTQPTLETEYVP